jgi:hypothetical protein
MAARIDVSATPGRIVGCTSVDETRCLRADDTGNSRRRHEYSACGTRLRVMQREVGR